MSVIDGISHDALHQCRPHCFGCHGKIQLFLRCDMLSTKAFWLLLEKFGRFLVLYIFLMTNTALLFTADGNHFVVFIL